MTRDEFLETLENSLNGEVPSDKVSENIKYYNDYISQSTAGGKSQEEVLEELGDPRLIAKTIIDTYKLSKSYQYGKEGYSKSYDDDISYTTQQTSRNKEYDGYHGRGSLIFQGTSLLQKILGVVVIIVVLFAVITLGSLAIQFFFRFGLPILLIYFVYRIIFNPFNRRQ